MSHPTRDGSQPHRRGLSALLARAGDVWRRADQYVRSKLVWNKVYRASNYLKAALWTVPFLAILLVLLLAPVLRWLDRSLGWRLVGLSASGAESLYQSVITLTLSFMVFTFGSLLVAIQVASGQLTPRIIAATLLRDSVVKYSVGLFVFTFVFTVMALDRLEATAHELLTLIVAALGIVCMATFLFLIDYAARLLRPVSILARVGNDGLAVIKAVYPAPAGDGPDAESPAPLPDGPRRLVRHDGISEIVLAVDLDTLVREAVRTGGIIEFAPQVGDFVASDEPLFVLHGGATSCDDTRLRATVAFGEERSMEQDPLFSFRIMVDIGLKALSPAINDPTTAVLAIDQIHRLLRVVGRRELRGETIFDQTGRPRRHLSDAGLGGLRQRRVSRNPQVRRGQRTGGAPPARDARQSGHLAPAVPPACPGARGTAARPVASAALFPAGRSGPGRDPRFAGTRRIVRRARSEGREHAMTVETATPGETRQTRR